MKVICRLNDPMNMPLGVPNNFDFGLELGKEYLVMGLLTYKTVSNLYVLIDQRSRPGWYPHQIFDFIDNNLPPNWQLKINIENDYMDYRNLIGFFELCNDETYFNNLLNREEQAMRIYFSRKIELEESAS